MTLGMFVIAMVLSFKFPFWGFGLVSCVLFAYLRPEASGAENIAPNEQLLREHGKQGGFPVSRIS
jgi:hypothetical protein